MEIWMIFILVIISFLLGHYFPKYFAKKGENQATKEDIGTITTIVEQIKSDLVNKTEELKAIISLKNQHRLKLKDEERQALFKYVDKLSERHSYLDNFSTFPYDENNYKELYKVFDEISVRKIAMQRAFDHLKFFDCSDEFLVEHNELMILMVDQQQRIGDYIFDIMAVYLQWEENGKSEPKKAIEHYAKLTAGLKELRNPFNEDSLSYYKAFSDLFDEIMLILRKRVKEIELED